MKWTVSYKDSKEPDVDAIRDIQDYLQEHQWNSIISLAQNPRATCRHIDFALSLTGVRGFPVHAFIRTFRPTEYQEWYDSLAEPRGREPVW